MVSSILVEFKSQDMLQGGRLGEAHVTGGKRSAGGEAALHCRPHNVAAHVTAADEAVPVPLGSGRHADPGELESLYDVAGLCTATVSHDYRIKACRYIECHKP